MAQRVTSRRLGCCLLLAVCFAYTDASSDAPIERVFVTGGSGYLGRNIIRHFVSKGVPVHAIARSEGAMSTVEKLGAVGVLGDLSDMEAMRKGMDGCDLVVHGAAYVKAWGNIAEAREVSVQGTRNVIAAAAKAGVRKVIHVGTEAGCLEASAAPLVNLDETVPLPEKPFAGIYSTTKNEAERAAFETGRNANIDVVVVRPRFIWGRDDTVLLPEITKGAKSGMLNWFDGGDYLSSTCHVDNVVEGIEKAATIGKPGESYFLTDGAPVVFKAFISDMLRATGVEPPTRSLPLSLIWGVATICEWICTLIGCEPIVARQLLAVVGQQVTVSDSKARRDLGYQAHMSIESGLKQLRDEFGTMPLGSAKTEL